MLVIQDTHTSYADVAATTISEAKLREDTECSCHLLELPSSLLSFVFELWYSSTGLCFGLPLAIIGPSLHCSLVVRGSLCDCGSSGHVFTTGVTAKENLLIDFV